MIRLSVDTFKVYPPALKGVSRYGTYRGSQFGLLMDDMGTICGLEVVARAVRNGAGAVKRIPTAPNNLPRRSLRHR